MALTTRACLYTATGLLGFGANTAQLILSGRDKTRKKSPFGLVLLSLCTADLLASLVNLMVGVKHILAIYGIIDSLLFQSLQNPLNAAMVFSLSSSFTHIVFIAVQRFMAVAFPFEVQNIFTKSRCYLILATLWIVSLALASIVYFIKEVFMALYYLALAAGVALVVTYAVLCYKLTKSNFVDSANEEAQRRHRRSQREVLVYSVAITAVFVICHVTPSLRFVSKSTYVGIVGEALCAINPFFDTLLYFTSSYCKQKREGAT